MLEALSGCELGWDKLGDPWMLLEESTCRVALIRSFVPRSGTRIEVQTAGECAKPELPRQSRQNPVAEVSVQTAVS